MGIFLFVMFLLFSCISLPHLASFDRLDASADADNIVVLVLVFAVVVPCFCGSFVCLLKLGAEEICHFPP